MLDAVVVPMRNILLQQSDESKTVYVYQAHIKFLGSDMDARKTRMCGSTNH